MNDAAYLASIRRNVTSTDTAAAPGITVRRHVEDGRFIGADVYVGGWRSNRATLLTETGITRHVDAHRAAGATAATRYTAAVR